jgi:hypothetical protein
MALEYTGDEWWAEVLADPRARRHTRRSHSRGALNIYRPTGRPGLGDGFQVGMLPWPRSGS